MADESVHELSAAYALHALDERESARYEEHLATCARCREDVASFSETAAALAYLPEPMDPPPALRDRILDSARSERPNVVPLRARGSAPVRLLAAATAVAASLAIGFGVWANDRNNQHGNRGDKLASLQTILEMTADPNTQRIALAGANGTLMVTPDRRAALVLNELRAAPNGKTYEAWVIADGKPRRAGVFQGGSENVLALQRPVPRGAAVAVTVERSGGVNAPTQAPKIEAQA
jgi:anti-sigma-K factor RskA